MSKEALLSRRDFLKLAGTTAVLLIADTIRPVGQGPDPQEEAPDYCSDLKPFAVRKDGIRQPFNPDYLVRRGLNQDLFYTVETANDANVIKTALYNSRAGQAEKRIVRASSTSIAPDYAPTFNTGYAERTGFEKIWVPLLQLFGENLPQCEPHPQTTSLNIIYNGQVQSAIPVVRENAGGNKVIVAEAAPRQSDLWSAGWDFQINDPQVPPTSADDPIGTMAEGTIVQSKLVGASIGYGESMNSPSEEVQLYGADQIRLFLLEELGIEKERVDNVLMKLEAAGFPPDAILNPSEPEQLELLDLYLATYYVLQQLGQNDDMGRPIVELPGFVSFSTEPTVHETTRKRLDQCDIEGPTTQVALGPPTTYPDPPGNPTNVSVFHEGFPQEGRIASCMLPKKYVHALTVYLSQVNIRGDEFKQDVENRRGQAFQFTADIPLYPILEYPDPKQRPFWGDLPIEGLVVAGEVMLAIGSTIVYYLLIKTPLYDGMFIVPKKIEMPTQTAQKKNIIQ
ncbi:twin-arginine translocation signal domain-containing protein [Candidatus Roizmanbacteria bacterium]|nr:twin-arginine translocation signal domain-containing protein [Candidatus Roizmanbacteria bacterium]